MYLPGATSDQAAAEAATSLHVVSKEPLRGFYLTPL